MFGARHFCSKMPEYRSHTIASVPDSTMGASSPGPAIVILAFSNFANAGCAASTTPARAVTTRNERLKADPPPEEVTPSTPAAEPPGTPPTPIIWVGT